MKFLLWLILSLLLLACGLFVCRVLIPWCWVLAFDTTRKWRKRWRERQARFSQRQQAKLERYADRDRDFPKWAAELRAAGITERDVTERYLRETRRRPDLNGESSL